MTFRGKPGEIVLEPVPLMEFDSRYEGLLTRKLVICLLLGSCPFPHSSLFISGYLLLWICQADRRGVVCSSSSVMDDS